eukprot:COSAG05_NODE_2325_length_3234_cov_181.124402_2_plen_514_part_00
MLVLLLLYPLASAGSSPPPSCTSPSSFDEGTDYKGNDLKTVRNVPTAAACCAACAAAPGCNAWTLWGPGEQCYLKTSAAGRRFVVNHTSSNFTGVHPPGPAPNPPAPTPSSYADALDCEMRSFFVQRAAQVNQHVGGTRAQQVADALAGDPSLPAGCTVRVPPGLPHGRQQPDRHGSNDDPEGGAIFADASKGSDTVGDGSLSNPYRSVGRALQAARTSGSGDGARLINLRAGTYFLTEPLELKAADSKLTIQTFPADEETAWLSGAVPLTGVKWKRSSSPHAPASANIWSADVSSIKGLPADGIRSLRVGGSRAILARYPNCHPETQLCFKDRGTTTAATRWLSAGGGGEAQQRYIGPNGTSRHFCDDKSDRGCDVQYEMNHGGAGCDLLTPNISHFCNGQQKIVGVQLNGSQAPHQPYADPAGALFSAMHGGSWCSFAYEVAATPGGYQWDSAMQQGHFTFSGGGQQCNRQESQHGALIVENVMEELDTCVLICVINTALGSYTYNGHAVS